jgi:hypothetical protein
MAHDLFEVSLIEHNFVKPIRLHFSILNSVFLPLEHFNNLRNDCLLTGTFLNCTNGFHKVKIIILYSLFEVDNGRSFERRQRHVSFEPDNFLWYWRKSVGLALLCLLCVDFRCFKFELWLVSGMVVELSGSGELGGLRFEFELGKFAWGVERWGLFGS